eukprot:gb/GFBE01023167.1/.p1 GENE.gb/GFBE01023167.1/~~gb/GFBE01023167.1/.p1  ORF type:complete len:237 (+),score=28.30 gb/GFBE01023167.1/:1-711(+)
MERIARRLHKLTSHIRVPTAGRSAVAARCAVSAKDVALTGHYSKLTGVCAEQAVRAFRGEVPVKSDDGFAIATFAGGCFWGPQLLFDRINGVVASSVGYAQGDTERPYYSAICDGRTGHTEAVQVYFDEQVVSYEELLNEFWSFIDPTVHNGQGHDFGTQYRTGIYYHTESQKVAAKASAAQEQKKWKAPIATEIQPARVFWPAELEHQNYLVSGGRFGRAQSNEKGCKDRIRCYG